MWGCLRMTKSNRYPSQDRYDQKNPVVSIRLTREELEAVERVVKALGTTKAELVREALWRKSSSIDGMLRLQYQLGLQEGNRRRRVLIPCTKCSEPIELVRGTDMHKAAMSLLMDEGWVHGDCHASAEYYRKNRRKTGPP